MSIPHIPTLPTPPTLSDSVNFVSRADAFMLTLENFSDGTNTAIDEMNNVNDNINLKYIIASTGGMYKGAWVSGSPYAIGDIVTYGSPAVYYTNQTGINTTTSPNIDNTNWFVPSQNYYSKEEVDLKLNLYQTLANAFGSGQTWKNVTDSRVMGTTYINSTNKPIMLHVMVNPTTTHTAQAIIDGITFYGSPAGAGVYCSVSVIVLPGSTYQIDPTNNSLIRWMELR